MALLILALLQRTFLMSSLMLLLVWLIFFMVLIKLLPILGTISGKTVKLMALALICLGNNRQDRSEERRVGKECGFEGVLETNTKMTGEVTAADLADRLQGRVRVTRGASGLHVGGVLD